MMLDKKTSLEIYRKRLLGFAEYDELKLFDDKVWVSQESLNSLLEDMGMYLDIYYDEKSDKDGIIHNLKIIYEELKGEKK